MEKQDDLPKVSVIIPTCNKSTRLLLVLRSLELQTYCKECFEVLIVDDGSIDNTKQILEREYNLNWRYIYQNNKGRAAARNKGVEKAKYSYLIFIDDDTILDSQFIENHMKIQQKYPVIAHGKICKLPYVKLFQDPIKGIFYKEFINNIKSDILLQYCISEKDIVENFNEKIVALSKISAYEKNVQNIFRDTIQECYWMGFCGGNVSLPKEWVINVGGFDENYDKYWGCEDLDLGYTLLMEGHPFIYVDEAVNYHLDHIKMNYKEEHKINMELFYKKCGDKKIFWIQDLVEGNISSKEFWERIKKGKNA